MTDRDVPYCRLCGCHGWHWHGCPNQPTSRDLDAAGTGYERPQPTGAVLRRHQAEGPAGDESAGPTSTTNDPDVLDLLEGRASIVGERDGLWGFYDVSKMAIREIRALRVERDKLRSLVDQLAAVMRQGDDGTFTVEWHEALDAVEKLKEL